ncbi:outer membrane efflux protein [Bacteroides sp. CAG:709]|nr:outer membrane efflux protein [Bacteroides sp. CAG:709]
MAAICAGYAAHAQTTLDECIGWAYDNYPQIKEMSLIEMTKGIDLKNAAYAWLPHLNISGKATWQSEVVEMPMDIPGMDINIPHDQYGLTAEFTQQIWDGGTSRSQKELAEAGAEVKKTQLETNLWSIRSRVQNVFLGIILIDKQLELNRLLRESLERSSEEVKSRMEAGVALPSDLDQVSVNILSCLQQRASLDADRKSYVRILGLLTGRDMTAVELAVPQDAVNYVDDGARDFETRPEMAFYAAQLKQNEFQRRQLNTLISPKLNLSLQGGYGRPGMNMLSGDFSGYFVAGLKLQWNIGALYTRGLDKRKVNADAQKIDLTRKSFILNSSVEAEQKNNAILKARDVLEKDSEIIGLRQRIRASGENQYREGTIKMNDYLSMLDEEYKAKANESMHEVQLMMAVYDMKNTIGK